MKPLRHLPLALAALLMSASVSRAAPPTNAVSAPAPALAEDSYQLNLQDKLLYSVQEDPVKSLLADEVAITPQGEAYFRISRGSDELITLEVRGKTLSRVKQELKAQLEADYYQAATVDVKLKEQTRRAGQVLFIGAVRNNTLPLNPNEARTIFEGIYQVGVTEFANLKKIKLSRIDPKTGNPETKIINLEAIKKGDRTLDIILQDGDRIEVPEKTIIF